MHSDRIKFADKIFTWDSHIWANYRHFFFYFALRAFHKTLPKIYIEIIVSQEYSYKIVQYIKIVLEKLIQVREHVKQPPPPSAKKCKVFIIKKIIRRFWSKRICKNIVFFARVSVKNVGIFPIFLKVFFLYNQSFFS